MYAKTTGVEINSLRGPLLFLYQPSEACGYSAERSCAGTKKNSFPVQQCNSPYQYRLQTRCFAKDTLPLMRAHTEKVNLVEGAGKKTKNGLGLIGSVCGGAGRWCGKPAWENQSFLGTLSISIPNWKRPHAWIHPCASSGLTRPAPDQRNFWRMGLPPSVSKHNASPRRNYPDGASRCPFKAGGQPRGKH